MKFYFPYRRFIAFILFLLPCFSFAFTKDDIKTFTLENGFKLCFLEDSATATVTLELNIRAGTGCQTPDNAGFFSLYADLLELEITTECVRAERTVAPAQAEDAFMEFAGFFKSLSVSDKTLNEALKKSQTSQKDFSSSAAGFINQAIDCRVFSEAPWKTQSGTSPKAFSSRSTAEVRTVLEQIHDAFYVPENAVLYISGNLTEKAAISLAQEHFGTIPAKKLEIPAGKKFLQKNENPGPKRFVITDDEFSPDMTQIVIQYRNFLPDEGDLTAAVMNKSGSTFKNLLLKQKNLALRSPQYIDVSSVPDKGSRRLIIQAICETTKVSPAVQGELFLEMSREKERITASEVEAALKEINGSFFKTADNSTLLMKNLAFFNRSDSPLTESFFEKNEKMNSLSPEKLNESYENSVPCIFVLCNTKNYAKNAGEFKKYGYERITRKNGAWYLLPQYKDFYATKNEGPQGIKQTEDDLDFPAKRFIEKNRSEISRFTLKNGIPVTVKNSPQKNTTAIMLSIAGGELLFAEKNAGLASILANSLSAMIQWQLDELYRQGKLRSQASTTARTDSECSVLTVSCSSTDAGECLKVMAFCTIFGDISPALADGITYDLRTQWRIQSGSPDFQLLCEAVRTIWEKPVTNLYEDEKDRPVQMEFTQIQSAYPLILDCTRFSLVIAGGIRQTDELKELMDSTFGELKSLAQTQDIRLRVKKLPIPKKVKKVRLRHQFFTDISADKAGPRPQILVPTTDFSDPLLYMLESPDASSTDTALYNALLRLLEKRLQEKVREYGQSVKVSPPDSDLPYGRIVITKIKHIQETEKLYSQTVREILKEIKDAVNVDSREFKELEKNGLLRELESLWVLNELEKTSSNEGTALLIQKGMAEDNSFLYLDQYEAVSRATAEDYYIIFLTYFPELPRLRLYSADTKK